VDLLVAENFPIRECFAPLRISFAKEVLVASIAVTRADNVVLTPSAPVSVAAVLKPVAATLPPKSACLVSVEALLVTSEVMVYEQNEIIHDFISLSHVDRGAWKILH